MKKLLYVLLAIGIIVPAVAFARGGGPVGGGGFHSSPAPSFHSAPSSSVSSGSSFHSSSSSSSVGSSIGSSSTFSSGSSIPRGSYYSGGTTHIYDSGMGNFWFYMYLLDHNNDQSKYKDNNIDSNEHFPYILILNKTAHDYTLVRYIGPDHKTEKVSPQEAEGLSWLNGEIKY